MSDITREDIKMTPKFEKAFEELLKIEGGYADDPADSGGKTRYGITEAVARKNGYTGSMKKLPLQVAQLIYKKCYWDALLLDDINENIYASANKSICAELFDSAVNVGTKRATTWLQSSLNVLNNRGKYWQDVGVDGVMGKKTLEAINVAIKMKKWRERLHKALNCLQGAFYIELATRREKDERFVGGWLDKRVVI